MSKFAMCIYSRMDTEGGPGFMRLLPMYKYGSGATQFISWGYFYYCCYWSFGGWFFKLCFEMLTMYLRYCSEYSTVPVWLLISWFQSSGSQIFLIMGYFVSGLVLVDHCPQEPSTTLIFHCCSSALLSPSSVPAPSCKPPWSLFLTLLVIFRPRSLWLAAVGYSKWSGGPSISTACGDFCHGTGRLGEDGWSVGCAVLKGEEGGMGMENTICGPPFRPWWPLVIHRLNLRTTDLMKKQDIWDLNSRERMDASCCEDIGAPGFRFLQWDLWTPPTAASLLGES